ncbi:uncharacterized protein LOC129224522 [Uloborus diversus]|uniref:uncharacterized protein LOC129224522 n=1 Tax=Uloborus diversus TaxID=327109 RepID=UPI00240A4FFB|nr:uncharacterized protein LOC129224522 [Uloborus diversus]
MAVPDVPAEILEHIFTFLDGHSFCNVKFVCKNWYAVGKAMQTKNWLWKHFCCKEIPPILLEELISFKVVPLTESIIDWMAVYKKWWSGKMIKLPSKSPKSWQAFYYDPITVIKSSGSYVLTGHNSGVMCVWNIHNGDLLHRVQYHLKRITDMALVDLLNLGSYGLESLSWAHHHIITTSNDFLIQVRSLLEPLSCTSCTVLNYHSDIVTSIRVFGDKFAVCSRDNTITLYEMKVEKPFRLKVSLITAIIGPADILLTLGFWHDQVKCITHSGRLKTFSSSTEIWSEKKYLKTSFCENGSENIVSVSMAFMFHNEIIMLLTADGKLVISVDEHCKHYNLMRNLKTVLVTLLLQGTTLALGGENGKLFLFHVPDYTSLKELDLSKPDAAIYLSEASIISIDISYKLNSLLITAATTESIYTIEWNRDSNFHKEVKMRSLSHFLKSS